MPSQLTLDSPYSEIITWDNARFKDVFNRAQIDQVKDNFRKYDQDQDGFLNNMDVKFMMESLGEPKTHQEIINIINEVDMDNDGKVSFSEFLIMLVPPPVQGPENDPGCPAVQQPVLSRIYKSSLASKAKFFEEAIFNSRDKTNENYEAIQSRIREKKKIEQMKKDEEEKERLEKERILKEKQESKARLAARAAMFSK